MHRAQLACEATHHGAHVASNVRPRGAISHSFSTHIQSQRYPSGLNKFQRPRHAALRAQSSDIAVVQDSTTGGGAVDEWDSFAAAASGEWDGLIGTYDADGEPQQLPEYYVPQAYRDWDVKLYDWQSQCSMLANDDGMKYCLRRLMPTVGCEADAIAFTEEVQEMFSSTPSGRTICPDGSYTHPPTGLTSKDVLKASAEHAFPLSTGQRIRVVHGLRRMGAAQNWKLMTVEVHSERYDTPYNGRRELAGCGGGMDPFATTEVLDAAVALQGAWRAHGVRYIIDDASDSGSALVRETVDGEAWSAETLPGGLIGLPIGVWSAGKVESKNADLAAGVVMDDGSVKVSMQTVRGGKLQRAEMLTLTKEA